MTSKQRAHLRGLAQSLEPVLHIGKRGVTPEAVAALEEVLEARELVKVTVLPNCEISPPEVADKLAGRARAECVQVIGKKVVLYKPAKQKPAKQKPVQQKPEKYQRGS